MTIKNRLSQGLCAAAAALCMTGAASAGDAEGRYAVKGVGIMPCQMFIEQAQQGTPQAAAVVSWLRGYISGVNMMIDNTYDLVTWQDGIMPNLLASTCSQMPQQPVAVAAAQLIQILGPGRLTTAEQPEEITVGEQKRLLYPSVIRGMQQALKDKGQTITVDGDFGPGTQSALRSFQTANGIEATGFPDPRTMIALFASQPPAEAQQGGQ